MKQSVAIFEKHVREDAAFLSIPWATYLEQTGLSISSSYWTNQTISPAVVLSGAGLADSNTTTYVLLSGGTDNTREYLENRVVFSDGSDAVYSVIVRVVDKVP